MAGYVNGVNLLPATGEFTYGTTPRIGQRVTEAAALPINTYFTPPVFPETDYAKSIDQLQAAFPACTTVAVVCAWFGNSVSAGSCQIYPSTTYINNQGILANSFFKWNGSSYGTAEHWQCSSLTETSAGLIPIPQIGTSFIYGGTPSDQSIVECITDLRTRGLRVVFYPFILMDAPGKPWRGRITFSPDVSSAASNAVTAFLGSAATSQFTRDSVNKTVSYSGSSTDFTYRRMILHYANLCVLAGGIDLFLIGSEFRGLETIRGPLWTVSGGGPPASWDYPFITGLVTLAADVRSVFDTAGFTKDTANLHNLISYAADWSDWMGTAHDNANPATGVPNGAQWPHLDKLWSSANIDLVCFDNYLPLSDWTTGTGGIDVLNWASPGPNDSFFDYELVSGAFVSSQDYGTVASAVTSKNDYGLASAASAWPPGAATMSNLGLTGTPNLNSKAYLKANIEGGERFDWFYFNSNNLGRGLDPNGSDLQVSVPGFPTDDRLAQSRNPFFPGQQILGQKQIRWWWNNIHQLLYDDGLGGGLAPHGNATAWVATSKSIVFTEYGFPSCDRCTNQPNVFFSPGSSESFTPYWSIWRNAESGGFLPVQDQNLQLLALQAIFEYWFVDGHNAVAASGLKMIQPVFCSVWNWDARPFPTFPNLVNVWGDAGNWQAGNWLSGKGPFLTPPLPDGVPALAVPFIFPSLPGLSWSVHKKPSFSTRVASHVSGREVRLPFYAVTLYEFELTIEGMDSAGAFPGLGVNSLQALMGLYLQCQGQVGTFLYTDPTDNTQSTFIATTPATGDGTTTVFTLNRTLGLGANVQTEPVSWITGTPVVHDNGAAAGAFTVTAPNMITFTTAPISGHAITATCAYSFNCRFLEDQLDFENVMSGLWTVQSLKFRSVRP
ncbi:MAG: baseplate megatron protein TIM-barrel domain-containing protein [Methylocella sp.]